MGAPSASKITLAFIAFGVNTVAKVNKNIIIIMSIKPYTATSIQLTLKIWSTNINNHFPKQRACMLAYIMVKSTSNLKH